MSTVATFFTEKGEYIITTTALFLPVLYTLLQLLSLMALGFVLARTGTWPKEFFQQLSRLMVRVALPINFFVKLSQTNTDDIRQSLLFPFLAICIISINIACAAFVFRFFPGSTRLRQAGIALATFGNSSIIPLTLIELFPLTIPIIGEQFGITIPSLYVGTFLLAYSPVLWSIGNFLVTGKGRWPRLRELITPPLLGIVAGLIVAFIGGKSLLSDIEGPIYHIFKSLERVGSVTVTILLICLGSMIARIQLDRTHKKLILSYTAVVSAIRFLFMPGIFFLAYAVILRHLALSPAQYWVIFLECHVPPATNLSIMAAQAGVNEDEVSFTMLVAYLIYIVVLPVYLLLFLALMGIS